MNLSDLRLRARALLAPRRVERELDDELAFHIDRETEKLVAEGMTAAEARSRAHARFGPVALAADECRDARGTSFVDNTLRDFFYALRTFRRAPLVAVTIVSTVALGLALVTVAFTMLNALLFRVDQVPDVHEMFAVERTRSSDGAREPFTHAQFDALRRETPVFSDAYAAVSDIDSRLDGRRMSGTFVTGNFFQVVRVAATIGRALTPADDEPSEGQPAMVLSHRGWDRLFARDPAILGRQLLVNGVTFEIVGVMPEGFRGLTVAPDDYWAPLSKLGYVSPAHRGPGSNDANVGLDIIGRLKPGLSRQTAQAGLAVWAAGQPSSSPSDLSTRSGSSRAPSRDERGAPNITLLPRLGTVQQPREAVLVTAPLFFGFGLILLIACANVANLLLARAVVRQREIGIRLSLGATRRRIIRQLLTESVLLALLAAAAGFAISRVALEVIINAVTTSWPPEIGDIRLLVPDADWRVALFLIIGAAVSTIVFGLAPALQATRLEPLRTIRGEVVRDARPGRARNFLIGLQVSASGLLLISAAVFLRSAFAATAFTPGMRISDIVLVRIANETNRTAIVRTVMADPSVAAVAASVPAVAAPPRAALAEAARARATVAYKFVSPEYFSVLDIAVVRGRPFTPDERSPNLSVAIVSEATALTLWPNADALGQAVRLGPEPNAETRGATDLSAAAPGAKEETPLESRTFTVVGVVRDVAGFRIAPFNKAVVYVPTSATMPGTSLVARVHGDPDLAVQTLLDRLSSIDPGVGTGLENEGQVGTMRWITRMETYLLRLAFWLTVVLGGLALALTLSGLFSVLSYLVEQRTREIGVRMALGATTHDVTRLVLAQSIRPVGFGLLFGGGAAAGLAVLLLATPAAAVIGEIVHVLDPVAYAGSLLIIVFACLVAAAGPATRAAHLDPTRALREE
jgi:putative ABC transport system permease protein